MKENKRELVRKVMNNEEGDRIPVGFWWHFTGRDEQFDAYKDPGIIRRAVDGHKKMYDEFQPDFVKIMSDGFFAHPEILENDVRTVEDLKKIKPITKDHPWITEQVRMVNEINEYFKGEVMSFYNIFAPVQNLRIYVEYLKHDVPAFQKMMMEYPEEVFKAAKIIADDTILLLEELKNKTKIDGIYYSVQSIQHKDADAAYHDRYIVPMDLYVLDKINALWEYNILHICGYEHYENDVKFYQKYKTKVYNWAVHTDKISLKEGKEIFNAAVIGGFDNNKGTLLDSGSEEEIREFVQKLIAETGRKGLIFGADCTVPADIDIKRLNFVRELGRK
ncbi:MAG: uroporphyrinogen decarboxylase family protein [Johnsonella sp.]|nr:uroporphyrinogen decarboxylase family protein [Johnsonella sp.]